MLAKLFPNLRGLHLPMRRVQAALGVAGWVLVSGFCAPPQASAPATTSASLPAPAATQLTPNSRRAYAEVLKLRLGPARELLRAELAGTPTAPAPLLVANCADFVELVVSQDASRYEALEEAQAARLDRKSTRLNSSHSTLSRMPSSA